MSITIIISELLFSDITVHHIMAFFSIHKKVKLKSLCLIKHYAIKTYGGAEV
jgi:hypothetical protein